MGAPISAEDVYKIFEERVGALVSDLREQYGEPAKQARRAALSKVLASEDRNGVVSFDPEEPRGKGLARFVMALAAGKGDPDAARKKLEEYAGATKSKEAKSTYEEVIKSLEASTGSAGGVFVPEDLRAEMIPLLRANNVVRASGAQAIPMPSGNMSMNFQASSATSQFVDELQPPTPSQPSFGRLKLVTKKLITLVPVSNDMIRFGMQGFDAMIRDDIVASQGNREDLALIRDTGSENTPKGLRHLAHPDNVFAATDDAGKVTLETQTNDLARCVEQLESRNIPLRRPGWLFTPRTKWGLMKVRDGNGNLVFMPEMRGGTLFGFPFRTTTQIPNNLGVGSDESEIYFADFASIVIGDAVTMEIDVFDGAAYQDGSDVRSGVSRDERVMRAITEFDMAARYRGEEISIVTGVTWGAPAA